MSDVVLELEGVDLGYTTEPVVRGATVSVRSGELLAILGANGAGKTTLMQGIAGQLRARSGMIKLHGQDITSSSTRRRVAAGIVLAMEGHRVISELSVDDNLRLALFPSWPRVGRRAVRARLDEIYETFPVLADRRRQLAGTMSGGEQQMLVTARMLITDAEVLLFDEPSLGLSPIFVSVVYEHIARLRDQGKAVVVVEQNTVVALKACDSARILRLGRLQAEDAVGLSREALHAAYLDGTA